MNKKNMANKMAALFVAACLLFAAAPAKAGAGEVSMKVGEIRTFQWRNATYEKIESASWSSANGMVASIASTSGQTATVKGAGAGTCQIYCRVTSYHEVWDIKENRYVIQDRMTDTFSWTVTVAAATPPQAPQQNPSNAPSQNPPGTNPPQPQNKSAARVKSIKLNKKKFKMRRGTKKTLHCSVRPASAKGSVKWKSSNKRVATVSGKGRVTAKRAGTAKITVYAPGIKKTCKVKVTR